MEQKLNTPNGIISSFGVDLLMLLKNISEKVIRYISKDVSGQDQYTDKEGNKKYITEVLCDNMVMMGGGKPSGPAPVVTHTRVNYGTQPVNQNDNTQENNIAFTNDGANDDLPF